MAETHSDSTATNADETSPPTGSPGLPQLPNQPAASQSLLGESSPTLPTKTADGEQVSPRDQQRDKSPRPVGIAKPQPARNSTLHASSPPFTPASYLARRSHHPQPAYQQPQNFHVQAAQPMQQPLLSHAYWRQPAVFFADPLGQTGAASPAVQVPQASQATWPQIVVPMEAVTGDQYAQFIPYVPSHAHHQGTADGALLAALSGQNSAVRSLAREAEAREKQLAAKDRNILQLRQEVESLQAAVIDHVQACQEKERALERLKTATAGHTNDSRAAASRVAQLQERLAVTARALAEAENRAVAAETKCRNFEAQLSHVIAENKLLKEAARDSTDAPAINPWAFPMPQPYRPQSQQSPGRRQSPPHSQPQVQPQGTGKRHSRAHNQAPQQPLGVHTEQELRQYCATQDQLLEKTREMYRQQSSINARLRRELDEARLASSMPDAQELLGSDVLADILQ